MTAWLEHKGTKREIRGTLSIGRLPENDLSLSDDVKVSRRHALIYEDAGGLWAVDFGSRNGVFVNGQPVRQPMRLRAGDEILVGDCRLKFCNDEPGTSARSAAPPTITLAPTADAGTVFAAGGNAVLLLDGAGRILSETEQAKQWLAEYYGADGAASLPARVVSWMESARKQQPARDVLPLVKQTAEKRLVIRLGAGSGGQWLLFLSEERPAYSVSMLEGLGLSTREAEVMHWVAEGKTNKEIGGILKISPSTVNKHVESILAKLGVENRAQAMLRVLEKLGRG